MIFIPVGTVELHGFMPLNVEYVIAETMAREMEEQPDDSVLTGLQFFHPGATTLGKGTVQISAAGRSACLYEIAKSLLHQGFRRQVYLSIHGPSHMTISIMIMVFATNKHVPLYSIGLTEAMFQKVIPSFKEHHPESL